MFQYDFMQHAFLAGTAVAIMCGIIGVYVIARGLAFITHTFSHVGFAGAAFAVFMSWNPLAGMLLFTTTAAVSIGGLGAKVFRKDIPISVVLSIVLGLGLLFLSLTKGQSNAMMALLFGSIVGIDASQVYEMFGLAVGILVVLILGYRMLTFDSFDPVGAESAGLPTRFISIAFLLLLSISVAEALQIVGALLVFTLMTTPAAAAFSLTKSVSRMLLFSAVFAVIGVWSGLTLSFYTNAPVSFYIAAVEAVLYFACRGWQVWREKMLPSVKPEHVSVSTEM
ncbi:metal ABC transporter permease [Alicyclobacillus pomorum]|uniref:metal ABC transporter permease n=1 Tax=Alicyclobacillus pomorum TaxID=204470 RepID=UPI000686ABD8|nr:metal ABC transporter permease [Alicyclobacillus pomorum]